MIPKRHLAFVALGAATYVVLSSVASAIPFEVPGNGQDIAKNGTGVSGGNGNDDLNNFFRLQTVINAYDLANPLNPLPTPLFAGVLDLGSATVTGSGLTGFDYAVLHYGAGQGGTQGSGGGVEVFFLNGAASFTFPANGSGQNGFGGFSSLTLFKADPIDSIPDGGSTVLLLSASLTALGFANRRLKGGSIV